METVLTAGLILWKVGITLAVIFAILWRITENKTDTVFFVTFGLMCVNLGIAAAGLGLILAHLLF
jgi:hypothetical protein